MGCALEDSSCVWNSMLTGPGMHACGQRGSGVREEHTEPHSPLWRSEMFQIWWSRHSDFPSLHHTLQAKGQGASSRWSHLSGWRGGEPQEHSRVHQSPGHIYRKEERRKNSIYYDVHKPVSLWRRREENQALLLTRSVRHHKSPFLNTSKDTPRPEQHYREPRNLLLWCSWPESIWTAFWENCKTNEQNKTKTKIKSNKTKHKTLLAW